MLKLITSFAVLLAVIANAESKLKVHVFYESLCPDSQAFITNQLMPNIDVFNNYIDIVMVPFGKSQSIGGQQFSCQHGPDECRLNKIMSCSLYLIYYQITQVKYVGCQMAPGADFSGQRCVESHGLSWNTINNCQNYAQGYVLQLEAEALQKRMLPGGYPSFVPTIVYNERFDQGLQDQSLYNFRGVLCSQLGPGGPC